MVMARKEYQVKILLILTHFLFIMVDYAILTLVLFFACTYHAYGAWFGLLFLVSAFQSYGGLVRFQLGFYYFFWVMFFLLIVFPSLAYYFYLCLYLSTQVYILKLYFLFYFIQLSHLMMPIEYSLFWYSYYTFAFFCMILFEYQPPSLMITSSCEVIQRQGEIMYFDVDLPPLAILIVLFHFLRI